MKNQFSKLELEPELQSNAAELENWLNEQHLGHSDPSPTSGKMLNRPKKLNAVSTNVLLQFFSPVCPLPHSIFSNKLGDTQAHFALITFPVMSVQKGT